MSDCEQFAQIAKDKWATVSKSLRSLRGTERLWANGSGRSRQMSNRERFAQVTHDKWVNKQFAQKIWLKNLKSYFVVCFVYVGFFIIKNERFAHFLCFGEQPWAIRSGRSEEISDREQIAQVAHQKLANEWIACFLTKLLIFGQKTSD